MTIHVPPISPERIKSAGDAIRINCALIEAFGLDPKSISANPAPTIRLDKHLGPIITVAHFCFDENGKKFVDPDGDVATILRQYKIVAIDETGS